MVLSHIIYFYADVVAIPEIAPYFIADTISKMFYVVSLQVINKHIFFYLICKTHPPEKIT